MTEFRTLTHRTRPGKFRVRKLPRLLAWFDAQAIDNVADAASVETWKNRVRDGTDPTEATNQPTYRATGLGSYPSLDFDGTNDQLNGGTGYPNLSGETNLWCFAVVAVDSVTSFRAIINKDDNVATTSRGFNCFIQQTVGSPDLIIPTSSSARVRRKGRTDISTYGPVILTWGYKASDRMDVYVNGLLDNDTIDGSVPASIGNDGGTFRIGRTDAGEYFNGDIGEIILCAGDLTADNDLLRRRVEQYLSDKWDIKLWSATFRSPDTNDHQGYSSSATKHFTSDTAAVRRRTDDASWTIETSNTSDLFTGAQDHVGDIHYVASVDKIYCAVEQYTSCASNSEQAIAILDNATGLPRDSTVALPGTPPEVSGLVIVEEHGAVYVCSFCDGSKIWKYTYSDLATLSSLTADGSITLSEDIGNTQGITYRDGFFYCSTTGSDTGGPPQTLWKVSLTGTAESISIVYNGGSSGTAEGVDYQRDTLRWMVDDGSGEYVHFLRPPPRTRSQVRLVGLPPIVTTIRRLTLLGVG